MACYVLPLGIIACRRGGGRQPPPCSVCHARPGTALCDGPPAEKSTHKTCDAPLCLGCARHVAGEDLDYCPRCAPGAARLQQLDLFALEPLK
jgi:hypothetical protein